MSRLGALLAATALAVTPLAATGCGADDVNPDALAQAADATRRQGGVHMTMSGTVETQGQKVPLEMEGDADLREMRLHSKVKSGGGIPEIEQVMIGTVMYMKMEGLEDAFGAEWVKLDLAAIGEEMGVDFEQMMGMSQSSPVQQLDYLRTAANLEEVGEEEIDGVATTHYKGELDLRKYPDVVLPARREKARRSVQSIIDLAGGSTFPVEVWVDEDSLVRRQRMTMTQKKPVDMKVDMTVDYTDFGKDVDIEAPSGAKDLTDVVRKSGG